MELKNAAMSLHSCYKPGRKFIIFQFYTVRSIFSSSSVPIFFTSASSLQCFHFLAFFTGNKMLAKIDLIVEYLLNHAEHAKCPVLNFFFF